MAKQTGLAWTTLEVDDATGTARDIRPDTTNLEFSTPREVQDVTGIDKSAMERLLLLGDFSATFSGVFNPAADQSHDVLKTISSTDVVRTVNIGFGGVSLAAECLLTDYKISRDNSGALTWETPAVLADGTVPTWA